MYHRYEEQKIKKHTLFIQGVCTIPILEVIKNHLSFSINKIIKEELHLDDNYAFDFFLPKDKERLTLYHLVDVLDKDVPMMLDLIDKVVTAEKNKFIIKHVSLVKDIRLFGEQKDE